MAAARTVLAQTVNHMASRVCLRTCADRANQIDGFGGDDHIEGGDGDHSLWHRPSHDGEVGISVPVEISLHVSGKGGRDPDRRHERGGKGDEPAR
jgi:hypothetical protein